MGVNRSAANNITTICTVQRCSFCLDEAFKNPFYSVQSTLEDFLDFGSKENNKDRTGK